MLRLPTGIISLAVLAAVGSAAAQTKSAEGDFRIALPSRPGQLAWHADGFKIVESSAKPHGAEIGIRGSNESIHLTFLGFLFLVPGNAPLTSAKCRDGALDALKKNAPNVKIGMTWEPQRAEGPTLAAVSYAAQGRDGQPLYSIRAFAASADVCGDLEIYGNTPLGPDDPAAKGILNSYHLDPKYNPQVGDFLLYAQVLYEKENYGAAAAIFEQALAKLNGVKGQETMRRVITDQAGMAYGISGDTAKARAIFDKAIASDSDYPMYYYNLACADAQEHKLDGARTHLQQAFARKANVIPGESMPDPSKDDSFLPYQNDKDFWTFIKGLH